jgi:hypothetical protein
MLPTTTTPPPPECFIQGEILPYLNETSYRGLRSFQGTFEICIGDLYGSVCDIGWNQLAVQTLCRDLYGNEYSKILITDMTYDSIVTYFIYIH